MQPTKPPDSEGVSNFAIWSKYEDIAMHFNEMILRLRFQGLAGVAGLVAVIGLITEKIGEPRTRWFLMAWLFVLLAVLWIALACLDFLYYNRLLLGAVKAIADLEKHTESNSSPKPLNLSRTVRAEIKKSLKDVGKDTWSDFRGPLYYYFIVLVCLLALAFFSERQHRISGGSSSASNIGSAASTNRSP